MKRDYDASALPIGEALKCTGQLTSDNCLITGATAAVTGFARLVGIDYHETEIARLLATVRPGGLAYVRMDPQVEAKLVEMTGRAWPRSAAVYIDDTHGRRLEEKRPALDLYAEAAMGDNVGA